MQNAGTNSIFFKQERIEELARFLVAIKFNGGQFTVQDGPNFGWTVEIIGDNANPSKRWDR